MGLMLAMAPTVTNSGVLHHSSHFVNSNFTNSPPFPSLSGPSVFCLDPDPKPMRGPCSASIPYLTPHTPFVSFLGHITICNYLLYIFTPSFSPSMTQPRFSHQTKFHESKDLTCLIITISLVPCSVWYIGNI